MATMSAKKVRQQLEEKLDCDLMSRKKEIDDLVMDYVNSKDKKKSSKKAKESEEEDEEEEASEDEEESEEEKKKPAKRASTGKKPAAKKKKGSSEESEGSEGSDAESDEEYSPKIAKPAKSRKGSESDSDEDWGKNKKGGGGKRGGGGYTRAYTLSPELASLVGAESMARHEVVKKIWSIIKERNLYDPKNKQYAICDEDLLKVIGTKRFRTFGMMKYLKTHFID